MKLVKTAQIVPGVALLSIGLSGVFTVFTVLVPDGGLIGLLAQNPDVGSVFAITSWMLLPPLFFLECGIFWIRESSGMGDTLGHCPKADIWSRIGQATLAIGVMLSTVVILAAISLIGAEIFFCGISLLMHPASLTLAFVSVGGVLAAYLGVRTIVRILWRRLGSGMADRISLGLSKCRLTDDGVEIDLNFLLEVGATGPRRFTVRFDELEEVRIFTHIEAVAHLWYAVGPNVPLGIRELREMYLWRRGKIPRPTVCFSTALGLLGKIILLRGPELFYLISFHAQDAGGLVEAFRRARPGAPLPSSAGV
jgi:hypothetical protein